MIAGLSLPPPIEEEIWRRFARWAEHFKVRLREKGAEGLLTEYEHLVRSIEAQSCAHGPNGSTLTGEDWQSCCGVSYEYSNDISVRDALAVFLELMPAEEVPFRQRVAALDARLRAFIESDAETADWWHRLPRGVAE
jgi:hypothetical protein